MSLGSPSPCPPVHQPLRKWMTPTTSPLQSSIFFQNISLEVEFLGTFWLGQWEEKPHLLSTFCVPDIVQFYWHSLFHLLPPITLRVRDILSASRLHEAKENPRNALGNCWRWEIDGEVIIHKREWLKKRTLSQVEAGKPDNLQQPHTHHENPVVSKETLFPIFQTLTYIYKDTGTQYSTKRTQSHILCYITDLACGPLWSLGLLQLLCNKPVFCPSHL